MSKKRIIDTAQKNNQKTFDIQNLIHGDSYKSLLYGIVTVIVLFVVIALGLKSMSQNKAQIDDKAASTRSESASVVERNYEVSEGETLWSISEKTYGDGFKWTEVARVNNIIDPASLRTGTKLNLPVLVKPESHTLDSVPNSNVDNGNTISKDIYVVERGDTLWDISVRAYGDGYRWVEIARNNSLVNPGLIFSGNILKLPRP